MQRRYGGRTVGLAALLLLLGLWTVAQAYDPVWRIVVRDTACVQGDHLTLGEIARLDGQAPPGVWEELSARPLWEAPTVQGREVQVTRDQLERLMARYLPDVADSIVLPSHLTYQLGGKVYGRDELTRLIVGFLTPKAKAMGGDAEIKDVRVPDDIFLAREYDRLEMALNGEMAAGRVGVKFRVVTSDGRVIGRYAASAFVNLWAAVPCAARPMGKLEEITPDKVTFMRKNLAYTGRVWDGRTGPYRLLRTVGTGMPLLMEYLEPMPLIAKGEIVTLVYEGGAVRLSVKAEAQNDADKGEMVQVKNLQSNKIVLATVQDEHVVVVR